MCVAKEAEGTESYRRELEPERASGLPPPVIVPPPRLWEQAR